MDERKYGDTGIKFLKQREKENLIKNLQIVNVQLERKFSYLPDGDRISAPESSKL